MLTREEARVAVHAELRSRNLSEPFGPTDLLAFCNEMRGRLQFRTQGEALSDIQAWTEKWEALWLRRNSNQDAPRAADGASVKALPG